MSEQLELIAQEPRLTTRQAEALAHLQAAGHEGITGAELGQAMGVRPDYAKSNGLQWLKALKTRGLAEQKRGGIWRAIGAVDNTLANGQTDEIPF